MGAYNFAFSGGTALGATLSMLAVFLGSGYPLAMTVCAVAPFIVLPIVLRRMATGEPEEEAAAL